MSKPHAVRTVVQSALIALFVLVLGRTSQAGSFTAGNIIVYRVGDGSGSLVLSGNPVFLDEYTPSGTLVQSIALPTSVNGSNQPLIAQGPRGAGVPSKASSQTRRTASTSCSPVTLPLLLPPPTHHYQPVLRHQHQLYCLTWLALPPPVGRLGRPPPVWLRAPSAS